MAAEEAVARWDRDATRSSGGGGGGAEPRPGLVAMAARKRWPGAAFFYSINCGEQMICLGKSLIYRGVEGEVDGLDRLGKPILPTSQKLFVVVSICGTIVVFISRDGKGPQILT